MSESNIDRIPDPLKDSFLLLDLWRLAPWVAEQVQRLGMDAIDRELARLGHSSSEALPMEVWVTAISRANTPLWRALQAG
jgi:hypothetical protein